MCAFVSLHAYYFSSSSKDYSYVYSTIRSCSTYLDHTWKTTLAGEYAPPAYTERFLMPRDRNLSHVFSLLINLTTSFVVFKDLSIEVIKFIVSCLFSPHKLNHFLRRIQRLINNYNVSCVK